MIRICDFSGNTIKTFSNHQQGQVIYHSLFGFVNARKLSSRIKMRQKAGLPSGRGKVLATFKYDETKAYDFESFDATRTAEGYDLKVEHREFKVFINDQKIIPPTETHFVGSEPDRGNRWAAPLVGLLVLLFVVSVSFMDIAEDKKEDQALIMAEPVAVVISQPKPKPIKHQALDPETKARKALTQNLGFLKITGKKNLKDAVGGLPTDVKKASPGVGPGGDQGSGGEMLVGMGKGLRKTTVGNTGVSGLGGVGTKGAGGGLGGYGDTNLGSGAGQSLSAQSLGSGSQAGDFGLDRSLIEATIMRYLSQVRACYEEGLKRRPEMIGQVTMNFEINGRGGVNFAKVARSSLRDSDVENCISNRMVTWKFPTPRGGVNVPVAAYPFMLRPMKSL